MTMTHSIYQYLFVSFMCTVAEQDEKNVTCWEFVTRRLLLPFSIGIHYYYRCILYTGDITTQSSL